MKFSRIATAGFLFAMALLAAGPALAEQVAMTMGEAEELLNGLATLVQPREVIIKEGAAERAVKVQPKGWSVGVIMAITKNIDVLKPDILGWQRAVEQRRLDFTGEDGKVSVENQRTIAAEMRDKRAEQRTYDLTRFKATELKPDVNEISPAVLSAVRTVLAPE